MHGIVADTFHWQATTVDSTGAVRRFGMMVAFHHADQIALLFESLAQSQSVFLRSLTGIADAIWITYHGQRFDSLVDFLNAIRPTWKEEAALHRGGWYETVHSATAQSPESVTTPSSAAIARDNTRKSYR